MTEGRLKEAVEKILKGFRGKVLYGEPLSHHTTLRVGGAADAMVEPADLADLEWLMEKIRKFKLPCFVIGAGSNLVVRDGGIRGLVIRLSRFTRIEKLDETSFYAESGLSLPKLCRFARNESLGGLEFACMIPGSVGGGIKMNAGIAEREISDVVQSVKVLSAGGEILDLTAREAGFGYRSSRIPRGVVLGGVFKLRKSSAKEIEEKSRVLIKRRKETQPLSYPNVGSIFKNPPGKFAGKLIEEVGLKGFRIGGAQISEIHANFIINRGNATAKDILALIKKSGREVQDKKEVVLELEAKIVGENDHR